jgi:hypothetical protein
MRNHTVILITVLAITGGVAAAENGEFFIQRAKLANQTDGSWSGPGKLDGVKGTLTLTGAPDPATDAVEFDNKSGFRTLNWTWVAGERRVAGCASNRIIIRPHGILLWDSRGAKITRTSAQERKYLGRKVALYGPTKKSDLTHAQISIHEFTPQKGSCR